MSHTYHIGQSPGDLLGFHGAEATPQRFVDSGLDPEDLLSAIYGALVEKGIIGGKLLAFLPAPAETLPQEAGGVKGISLTFGEGGEFTIEILPGKDAEFFVGYFEDLEANAVAAAKEIEHLRNQASADASRIARLEGDLRAAQQAGAPPPPTETPKPPSGKLPGKQPGAP